MRTTTKILWSTNLLQSLKRAFLGQPRRNALGQTSNEAGVELFEFALIGPLLLTLMLGILWMGRAYSVYEGITRAAREGARYAVLPSCATCGNVMVDTYTAGTATGCTGSVSTNAGFSGGSTTPNSSVFVNNISPALTAANLRPAAVLNYCQTAIVMDPNTNADVKQCGVNISFQYPVTLAIPFTSLNAKTINISTQVQMRMENQDANAISGALQCP
jgi:Flp pilus assembly protein TadG